MAKPTHWWAAGIAVAAIAVILAVVLRPPNADGTPAGPGASREAAAPPAPQSRSLTAHELSEPGVLPLHPPSRSTGAHPAPGA